jgi:hypothetical protein
VNNTAKPEALNNLLNESFDGLTIRRKTVLVQRTYNTPSILLLKVLAVLFQQCRKTRVHHVAENGMTYKRQTTEAQQAQKQRSDLQV